MYGDISILDDGPVTIKAADYRLLLEAAAALQKLYDAGVDNWEGYDVAFPDD